MSDATSTRFPFQAVTTKYINTYDPKSDSYLYIPIGTPITILKQHSFDSNCFAALMGSFEFWIMRRSMEIIASRRVHHTTLEFAVYV